MNEIESHAEENVIYPHDIREMLESRWKLKNKRGVYVMTEKSCRKI